MWTHFSNERDFEKSRRQQFISRIATGDYDCIIMSHSQFEKIPISATRKERMLNEQIKQIAYAIEETKEKNGERWTVKQPLKGIGFRSRNITVTVKNAFSAFAKKGNIKVKRTGADDFVNIPVNFYGIDRVSSDKNPWGGWIFCFGYS